jgi:hypothetical protein
MNQLNCFMMIALAATLLVSPTVHAAERARRVAATHRRLQAESDVRLHRLDNAEVPVRVVGPEEGLRLTLTSSDGKPHQCVAPCTVTLSPGELTLALPWNDTPLTLTVDQPSFITVSPPSQAKLIGGAALAIAGAAVIAVAIIGGRSGNIGILPAALLGGLGGGATGLGGTLIAERNGGAEVEPWKGDKP